MIVKTRIFELYTAHYKNLSELAHAMEISVSQIYRVKQGARNINQKFIIGAIKAFPGYRFDDLFYFAAMPFISYGLHPRQLRQNRITVTKKREKSVKSHKYLTGSVLSFD